MKRLSPAFWSLLLAPVLIVISSSVSSSSAFAKELGHFNAHLHKIDHIKYNQSGCKHYYPLTYLGEHVHQLGHDVAITFRINKAGRLAQIAHSASPSCIEQLNSNQHKVHLGARKLKP